VDPAVLTGASVAASVLAGTSAVGVWLRRSTGRLRPVRGAVDSGRTPGAAPTAGLLAGLGVAPGTPATLVQFSSAFCTPCRAARRVCAEVAATLEGVEFVEVDAESRLGVVRALHVWRTPTVLIVDAAGRVVRRATGVPDRAQVIAAVAPLLSDAEATVP
jgi:thiol-disulfide isomerase/thioredoxin